MRGAAEPVGDVRLGEAPPSQQSHKTRSLSRGWSLGFVLARKLIVRPREPEQVSLPPAAVLFERGLCSQLVGVLAVGGWLGHGMAP